jgi:peptidoglycan-associated lipoprotein
MPPQVRDNGSPASGPDARLQELQSRLARTLVPIYFEYDRFTLSESARKTLTEIAELMREYPEVSLTVEGHADERGTETYNLALGDRRAQAAREYLGTLGVGPSRLATLSFGEEKPAMEGEGDAVWSKNRRDEFRASY